MEHAAGPRLAVLRALARLRALHLHRGLPGLPQGDAAQHVLHGVRVTAQEQRHVCILVVVCGGKGTWSSPLFFWTGFSVGVRKQWESTRQKTKSDPRFSVFSRQQPQGAGPPGRQSTRQSSAPKRLVPLRGAEGVASQQHNFAYLN